MRSCYDPEIPVNIVDLGLIYADCKIEPIADAKDNYRVNVKMTLTAPSVAAWGPVLQQDVQSKFFPSTA